MNKRVLYGVSIVIIAALVVVGCGLFDRDKDSSPTGPGSEMGNWVGQAPKYSHLTTWISPDSMAFAVVLNAGKWAIVYNDTAGNAAYLTLNFSVKSVVVVGMMFGPVANVSVFELDSSASVTTMTKGAALPASGLPYATVSSTVIITPTTIYGYSAALGEAVGKGPQEVVTGCETTWSGSESKAFGFKEMKAVKVSLD
jgi:hypothetical protein